MKNQVVLQGGFPIIENFRLLRLLHFPGVFKKVFTSPRGYRQPTAGALDLVVSGGLTDTKRI